MLTGQKGLDSLNHHGDRVKKGSGTGNQNGVKVQISDGCRVKNFVQRSLPKILYKDCHPEMLQSLGRWAARHDSQQVDLAFVVDCTGSMGSYIAQTQRNITLQRQLYKDCVQRSSCISRVQGSSSSRHVVRQ